MEVLRKNTLLRTNVCINIKRLSQMDRQSFYRIEAPFCSIKKGNFISSSLQYA